MKKDEVVHSDPEIMSGTPVFVGTRVPVKALFDYIEAGDTLTAFLQDFPGVSRQQALAALDLAQEALATSAGYCLTSASRCRSHEISRDMRFRRFAAEDGQAAPTRSFFGVRLASSKCW